MTDFVGTSGDDRIVGTDASDSFDLSQGGNDLARGSAGDDTFNMGGAFTAADRLLGGPGNDIIVLDGDYSHRAEFSVSAFSTIERVSFESGHDYKMRVTGTAAAFTDFLSRIGADDHLILNARGMAGDLGLLFEGGAGIETILGSRGLDEIHIHGVLGADDRIDGGAGAGGGGDDRDRLYLDGDYSSRVVLHAVVGFEFLLLAGGNDYDLKLGQRTVGAAGMEIDARALGPGDRLQLDASKVTAGHVSIMGGRGDDILTGGSLSDTLDGGKGNDQLRSGGGDELTGGAGADRFIFAHVPGGALITDLTERDTIDLRQIDADTTLAGNQAFHLVGALSGHPGELSVSYDSVSDSTQMLGDVNGDGFSDLVINASGDQTGFTHFVL